MGERLYALVESFEIGESSYRKTRQNLILAFAFKGCGVPLALTGWVYPIWAMVVMVASMTTVLVNSFGGRLLEVRENKPEEVRAGTGPAAGPPVTRSDTTAIPLKD